MSIYCHCHTVYSTHPFWGFDALGTPRDMIKVAMKRGMDGLAIVDHNDVKGSLIAKKVAKGLKFTIITGSEIKTASGDLIALGIKENVPMGLSVEETVEKVHALGGITIAAHPYGGYLLRKCLGNEAPKADAVEIFNATVTMASNRKAEILAKKFKRGTSAGSDAHSTREVGYAGIECDKDPIEAILKRKVRIFGHRTPLSDSAFLFSSKFFRSVEWRMKRRRGSFA